MTAPLPSRLSRLMPIGLVLLCGTSLSVLIFQLKQEAISENQRAVFSELAHEYSRGFRWELDAHLNAVESLRDFLLASPETDRAAFASFARGSLQRGWALRSLQWIPSVDAEQRPVLEEAAVREGFDGFSFFRLGENGDPVPAPVKERYFPVYFAEPLEESRTVLGFDYGSDPAQYEQLLNVTRTGSLFVSGPIAITQDRLKNPGILLLLPVFSGGSEESETRGFVAALLQVQALGQKALGANHDLIRVELFDITEPSAPVSLFTTGPPPLAGPVVPVEVPLSIGGRSWRLAIAPAEGAVAPTAGLESWSFLAVGLLFTSFVAGWMKQRQEYVLSVESKVNERTTALARINDDLQNEMAQRRMAEQNLLQSEARFREAFLHAPAGIGLLSPAGRWIQVNEALTKMTGFSEDEFYQQNLADIIHPDEVQAELARMGQMLAGAVKTFVLEQRFRHKDGHYIWVLLSVSQVRGEDQQLLYFICQIIDITERKKAMEETRKAKEFSENIIRSSSDGIFALDLQGCVTLWNSGLEEMTGIPAAEAVGRPAKDVLPFLVENREDRAFQRVLAGGTVRAAERPFSIPASGRSGFFSGTYTPLHDSEGGITGGVAVVRDVTEQREARERLQAFTELLKQRNRELQDFAYVASHDLQEPLRKVRAFGDRLEKKCAGMLDEQGLDYLKRMRDAAGRMQTLIADLLAFSRISTEASPFASVDLGVIAREVLDDLESRIEETAAEVILEPLPTIEADATQMRQLLQNLIGNGLKYHHPDRPLKIRIFATRHAAETDLPPLEGAGCLLHVQDNGIGFDEKYLDRIFTVFQRLHGRNEYQGTGVGLAICRKIAERHNGWITAKSKPDVGSTFIAGLPYKQTHQ